MHFKTYSITRARRQCMCRRLCSLSLSTCDSLAYIQTLRRQYMKLAFVIVDFWTDCNNYGRNFDNVQCATASMYSEHRKTIENLLHITKVVGHVVSVNRSLTFAPRGLISQKLKLTSVANWAWLMVSFDCMCFMYSIHISLMWTHHICQLHLTASYSCSAAVS